MRQTLSLRRLAVFLLVLSLLGLIPLVAQEEPPPPVPPPAPVDLADIPPPGLSPYEESNLEFYLDALAPLGTAEGNAAVYFRDFSKQTGERIDDYHQASGRLIEVDGQSIFSPDDPFLLEAEPWTRLAQMRFYPELLGWKDWRSELPNLMHFMRLAKSWRTRGLETGGEAAREDSRMAIRLGRLLRQDDVSTIQDDVGLGLIRAGLDGLYRVARREEDAATMVLAANALAETEKERGAYSSLVSLGISATCGLERKPKPHLTTVTDDDVEILLNIVRKQDTPRRVKLDGFQTMLLVLHAGTPEQREMVKAAFQQFTEDPDPILSENAIWCLEQDWESVEKGYTCIRQIG